MRYKEVQLTSASYGHLLNSTQCFSPDDEWLVYDTRNDETKIISTLNIEAVNTKTKAVKLVYKTPNGTVYGPGVGAATFAPIGNKVLFIHGIRNADKEHPYDFTRRTGVAIDLSKTDKLVFMDARNISQPFTPGALRGGTHAHTWSGDGKWISFTYNDYILQQLAKVDSNYHDRRVVGVMSSVKKVVVNNPEGSLEDNNGEYFAAVVTQLTDKPKWGSDEIDKAFDECWIGNDGYIKENGLQQKHAIAFQGNVYNEQGKVKTELFVVDLPADITQARTGFPIEGTATSLPNVPAGVSQRRITFTNAGVKGPRHWLRANPNGSSIAFLAEDVNGLVQIYGISPNGGKITQITFNKFSVSGPFNFSPDGQKIAYIADGSVFVTDLQTHKSIRETVKFNGSKGLIGAPIWSNNGKMLAYNKYVTNNDGQFLQLFLLH
ncbi:DUF3748 domain-containing protein [Pedobacter changchengzhani]|uniref:DUF3748 domain-containing protein n=1 Tax=Pedobacter changchengzhani TaxID=2529274 RepID=A0A4R5MIQ2_9SPHI|nr:DUF3748 domain-containing protein [Pedobacter changchengzhani]TDG35420.1 DUF3748 domain-containing protein [Pedobacter changchengzhani]